MNQSINDICQHRPKKSPYTKHQRNDRREEVFKLHFEYGYSARSIAKLMSIDRNTINNDIKFLYSQAYHEDREFSLIDWINRQVIRFESQRVRLRKELDRELPLSERLQIERMLLDVDSKVAHLMMNVFHSTQTTLDVVVRMLNNNEKENKTGIRYIPSGHMRKVSIKDYEKIQKIINKK